MVVSGASPVFIGCPVNPSHLGKNRVNSSCYVLKFSILRIKVIKTITNMKVKMFRTWVSLGESVKVTPDRGCCSLLRRSKPPVDQNDRKQLGQSLSSPFDSWPWNKGRVVYTHQECFPAEEADREVAVGDCCGKNLISTRNHPLQIDFRKHKQLNNHNVWIICGCFESHTHWTCK